VLLSYCLSSPVHLCARSLRLHAAAFRGVEAVISARPIWRTGPGVFPGQASPPMCPARKGRRPTFHLTGASCPVSLLHPRKRRNTERGPEAGVRGASPRVWVRRTGGHVRVYRGGSIPYSHFACLCVCVSVCISMSRGGSASEGGSGV